jgi:nitrous oxidase accessory protein NosD
VFVSSGVRILGSGNDSVLIKNASHSTTIVEDSDWYDQEITLAEGHGFEVGDGVCLQVKNPHDNGPEVLKRTLVARNGNRFKLDKPLRTNFWLTGKPTASSLFPLVTGEYVENIVIENLALDGNRKENENFNGNYGGCLFFQDCSDLVFRGLTTRNYNGDGISWQICHDVTVENCHSHDNADLGLHPGSGSQRPLIRNNKLERNNIGIFFCWGVKYGLAEGNTITDTRGVGVSIGHNDTDNIIRNNDIKGSGQYGVLFRDESRGKDFWPNRNRIENNSIVDSGAESGVAIEIQGNTREIDLVRNTIRENRQPMQRTGVRIAAEARDIRLDENVIEGFAVSVADNRK